MTDVWIHSTGDVTTLEPRTARAKAFLRWRRHPTLVNQGDAADLICLLVSEGFDVRSEQSDQPRGTSYHDDRKRRR